MQETPGPSIGSDEYRQQNIISCYTLVDISKTGVIRPHQNQVLTLLDEIGQEVRDQRTWERSRNQQRNFETVLQIIGLRTQPMLLDNPSQSVVDLGDYNFGANWNGNHKVWCFKFSVEYVGIFDRDSRDLIALAEDMHHIPCITGLTETASLATPVFVTTGPGTNVYFKKLI